MAAAPHRAPLARTPLLDVSLAAVLGQDAVTLGQRCRIYMAGSPGHPDGPHSKSAPVWGALVVSAADAQALDNVLIARFVLGLGVVQQLATL